MDEVKIKGIEKSKDKANLNSENVKVLDKTAKSTELLSSLPWRLIYRKFEVYRTTLWFNINLPTCQPSFLIERSSQ